jgi:hypothetical protein
MGAQFTLHPEGKLHAESVFLDGCDTFALRINDGTESRNSEIVIFIDDGEHAQRIVDVVNGVAGKPVEHGQPYTPDELRKRSDFKLDLDPGCGESPEAIIDAIREKMDQSSPKLVTVRIEANIYGFTALPSLMVKSWGDYRLTCDICEGTRREIPSRVVAVYHCFWQHESEVGTQLIPHA